MILWTEGATKAQEDEAEDIINILTMAYPGHPWAVRVYDGGFFIRHLAFEGNYGMNCKFSQVGHDAAVMRRQIIHYAGEWLERAGIKRGRYDGDQEIGLVEGVPAPKIAAAKDVVIQTSTEPLRETPRPQVLNS